MSSDEFQSLYNIYEGNLEGCHKTTYVLQFMWRDLTSNFDVIGPYFTLSSTIEATSLYLVTKTMLAFHKYNFSIRCLLCDGASSNLALLKMFCCHEEGKDIVSLWFLSPLDGKNIYLVVCPSHQVCLCSLCKLLINWSHYSS